MIADTTFNIVMRNQIEMLGHLTEDSIDAFVDQHLRSERVMYEAPNLSTRLGSPNNKWRVASAWQKAIRMGRTEMALRCTHALWLNDAEYCWRRFSVIITEDIGVANMPLQLYWAWIAGKKAWRLKNGGDWYWLAYFVQHASESKAKSQTVNELIMEALVPPSQTNDCFVYAHRGPDQLRQVLQDDSLPRQDRVLAAFYLVGTRAFPMRELLPDRPGSIVTLLSAYAEIGVPPAVQLIARSAANRMREGMAVTFPLAYLMAKEAKVFYRWVDDNESLPDVGMYPSSAFDGHNQEGKRAISYFLKSCPEWTSVVTPMVQGDMMDFMKGMVFFGEGRTVDHRLIFNDSDLIAQNAINSVMLRAGIKGDDCQSVYKLFQSCLPKLHYARLRIMDLVPSQSQAP